MERLTRREIGGVVFVGETISDRRAAAGRALNRLAAYEDTGLEPEEIERLQEYMKPFTIQDMDRFREIMDAEKDGRLVVLPEEKELTDEEIAEMTGYKCPICKHHHLCTMPGMQAICGESYTHFEPRKPQEAEEALRKEGEHR